MVTCTFENGGKTSLRHVVVDAMIIEGKKILLIRRAKHLYNGGKWGIIGGYLDFDENLQQGLAREIKEEVGLETQKIKLFKIIDSPNRKNEDRQNVAFVYIVRAKGKIKVDPKEVSEAKWFDFNNLPKEADFAFDHFEIIREYLK